MNYKFKFAKVASLLLCALSVSVFNSPAANWGTGYGIGNSADQIQFSGAGAPLAVISSVHSNATYYITSAFASGAPSLDQINFKTDMLAATLKFYAPTQTFTIASNALANTNILWLAGTNSGLATNDLCILWDQSVDSYQLLVVSGNATDASGLVYTNASGYCGVKFFTTVSNAFASATSATSSGNSKLFKLASIANFTPLAINSLTNSFGATNAQVGQWLPLAYSVGGPFITFNGPRGLPTATVLTHSNAGGLLISGRYNQRR